MDSLARGFVERIRAGLAGIRDMSRMADWIEMNTRHPKQTHRHWSFAEHEYQAQIVNDSANDLVAKKCAQVGLSEISVRLTLGLININVNSTAIYTLPTAAFATHFAKSRFDPVIKNSPDLKPLMDRDIDSASLKKMGGSFLYIRGTFSQSAAISIPADILVHDEVDFSDQKTLSSFTSRLGHVKEENIIRRRFSTPTVSGYGVSLLFDDSKQFWYAVKCKACESWQVPKFLHDVIIPGYSGKIIEMEREDISDPRYKISEAYLKCPGCGKALTMESLGDPDRRQWVAARPSKDRSGYQIQPFDVPAYNPVARTLRAIDDYERKADWVNFNIGQDYQDADSSFVKEAVEQAFCLDWVQPRPGAALNCVIGIDVGKTSWIKVMQRGPTGAMDVIHYERVKVRDENTLPDRAEELYRWYGGIALVIDAGPEWTEALAVINRVAANKGFACYYSARRKVTMEMFEVDEDSRVVSVDRTALISKVAKDVNTGKVRFARAPDKETVKEHLDNLKKIRQPNAKGDLVDTWINNGPDHYGHALFFANVAYEILSYKPKHVIVPALPMPVKAKLRGFNETGNSFHDRSF